MGPALDAKYYLCQACAKIQRKVINQTREKGRRTFFLKFVCNSMEVKNIIFDLGGVLVDLDMSRTHRAFQQFFGEKAVELRSEEHTSELQSRPHLVCRL